MLLLQTRKLKTTQINFLTVPQVQGPTWVSLGQYQGVSRAAFLSEGSRDEAVVLPFPVCRGCLLSSACGLPPHSKPATSSLFLTQPGQTSKRWLMQWSGPKLSHTGAVTIRRTSRHWWTHPFPPSGVLSPANTHLVKSPSTPNVCCQTEDGCRKGLGHTGNSAAGEHLGSSYTPKHADRTQR